MINSMLRAKDQVNRILWASKILDTTRGCLLLNCWVEILVL